MADESPVVTTAAPLVEEPTHSAGARSIHELRVRLLSGSAIMLLSSMFVGGVNLIYNFAVAHVLGADQFGHASVVYTLLMLLSSVTLSFQLLCSKFVARSESAVERVAIYRLLHRRAWLCGIGIGLALAAGSSVITRYLNLPSRNFIFLLACATVFYVPLGVRRGLMQGTYDFRPLAINFVLEVIVKLVGAVVLMSAGYGVIGVVAAMTASVIVAYFVAIPRQHDITSVPRATLRAGLGEGVQAATFFIGQVVINNLDIILVKHFFDATAAGVYAAVALAGRVVYMLSWSVVSSMFPFSAGVRSEDKGGRAVLSTALLLVVIIATVFTFGAWLAPSELWQALLGRGFPVEAHRFYSSLLVLYAFTTAIYSFGVVLMTYEISRKIGNVSWVQLGFSGAIVVGIYLFHSTLREVIIVQFVLMLTLLLLVSVPFVRAAAFPRHAHPDLPLHHELKKIRKIEENEAIAEFLRSEFYQPEFSHFREPFADLVSNPDFTNERDNSLRRALLYRRRGRLWRELPPDTEWWEVELTPDEILRMRVFPRNQWLRYGTPSFLLLDTAERIRSRILYHSRDPFIMKLRSLSIEMAQNLLYSSVILITIDSSTPLTIIEGNHRMTAAALVSPSELHTRFRFLCGFSPRMAECCWYQTDVFTLWHYAKNTVAYYFKYRNKLTTEILEGGTGEPTPPTGVDVA
jgi:O-antigen/teichoic acid export membrane protein